MVKLSKSGARVSAALKGGHPPAVKAGRKRVSKKQANEENGPVEKEAKKPAGEKPRSVVLSKMQSISILLAGTLEKLGREFPTSASIVYQKPRPTIERPHTPRKLVLIQQPRKF
ncbi:death associated protein 1b [Erpetoichthys calabaricus]|uniref:Death associated protein like 1 n=1 Tax=Erpetoichthys calabaricus TaxID=27687 RepID=A0A8C4S1B7_ERPCA|nr:death associated protein 1b [Erpetoichthys calabaricus]